MREIVCAALVVLGLGSGVAAAGCFVKPCFPQSDIQVIRNISYGSAYDSVTKQTISLTLDGLDGSIGLTTDLPAEAATEDAKAAVRFVRKMNVSWSLDPTKVMIAGDSAGAGYASAGRHGSSGNAGFSDEVGAVVSVSGELKSQAFCKVIVPKPFGCSLNLPNKDYVGNVTGPPQPPLVILHGTADYTVPYVNGLEVYTRAKSVGLPALLLTVPGGGHVPFDSLFNNATRMDQLMTFLDLQFATNSTCACN
eukprot:m.136470 g.136470  ORF g.136470 m.136470 type:complete len:251 (+) comp13945_c0_seq2:156-908(+)